MYISKFDKRNTVVFCYGNWSLISCSPLLFRFRPIDKLVKTGSCRFQACQFLKRCESQSVSLRNRVENTYWMCVCKYIQIYGIKFLYFSIS